MSVEQLVGLTFPIRNTVRANPAATDRQQDFIATLLRDREVPGPLRARASDPTLTTTAATELIDELKKCPRAQRQSDNDAGRVRPGSPTPSQPRGIAFIPDNAEPPF